MVNYKQKIIISKREEQSIFKSNITFGTLTKLWMSSRKMRIKESTYVKYNNLLNIYILPEFKDILVQELSYCQIDDFANKLLTNGGKKKSGLSAKTVNDCITLIRTILRYAQNNGISVKSLGNGIVIKSSFKELNVLSLSEQKCLYNYLIKHLNPKNFGVLLCLLTGLRIGEICALRWEDISLIEKSVYVHSTLQRIQDFSNISNKKTRILISSPKSPCSIRTILMLVYI